MTTISTGPGVRDSLPGGLADLASSMNWSPPAVPRSASRAPLARAAARLFEASPALTSEVDRRQARLLASINLLLCVIYAQAWLVTRVLFVDAFGPDLHFVFIGAFALSALAYGLSRTRHVEAAVLVSLGVQWSIPLAAVLVWTTPGALGAFGSCAWLSLVMMQAIGFARLRATVVVVAACFAVPIAAGLAGRGQAAGDVPQAVAYVVSLGGLTIALSHHRAKIEQDRSAELRARNADLLALGEHLSARRTELKKTNQALERAYADLQRNQHSLLLSEKMASLGRLTAGIAHEMNSPLAAVRGALAEARALVDEYGRSIGDRDVTDEDHRAIVAELGRSLELADKGAERASSFVRNIKSRTRDIGAHDQTPFDVVGTVRDALQMLGHEVTRARGRVELTAAEERIQMVGFPGKLSQVVTNLVSNALDANVQRGGSLVRVGVAREGAEVVLTVGDEGPGIPPEQLPRIFEPLFTTKPVGKGTGLGLTIVHDIVYGDFHGRIDVSSPPGGGASFAVRLPVAGAA